MKRQTFTGTYPRGVAFASEDKPCDRCGKRTSRNTSRHRKDGLRLCRDCTSDKWFIEKVAG